MNKIKNNLVVILLLLFSSPALACTSFLVTPGASADGSSMITYAADSHIRYGELYYFEGGPKEPGSYYDVFHRWTHEPIGRIPYPESTYTVVGYINEKQVAIGESTFGGREELVDTLGGIDYTTLIHSALMRAPTARDAIKAIVELANKYGYYSMGESFSIADPYEVWHMELIGKGVDLQFDAEKDEHYNANKGIVWVAKRIPDGYVSAHANHARITTFPLEDGKTSITDKNFEKLHNPDVRVMYAHDVISFARDQGYYEGRRDRNFSFSDAYAPIDFGAARFCEIRVWSFFRQINSDMEQYKDYALGYDLENRMPLYIKPDQKLSLEDVMTLKRDYLQGTEYDMTKDVGAGPFGKPYRWRPLTFEVDGKTYIHERATATQQTAFSFVTQSRRDYPGDIGGIIWFGVDDVNTTVYVPMYAGIHRAPELWAEGYGHIIDYVDDAAFWVFNKVANFAYSRYDLMIDDIKKVQSKLEQKYMSLVPVIDETALALYEENPELAKDFLTQFSVSTGNSTVERWEELFRFLMVKYLDGNVKKEEEGEFLTNEWGKYPIVEHPGYPDWWLELIIEKTGDKFLYIEDEE